MREFISMQLTTTRRQFLHAEFACVAQFAHSCSTLSSLDGDIGTKTKIHEVVLRVGMPGFARFIHAEKRSSTMLKKIDLLFFGKERPHWIIYP